MRTVDDVGFVNDVNGGGGGGEALEGPPGGGGSGLLLRLYDCVGLELCRSRDKGRSSWFGEVSTIDSESERERETRGYEAHAMSTRKV